jgi:hypothetical protein
MNKIITEKVIYRGREISINELKEQSNIKIIVECRHGQREVKWYRRYQLCYKCVSEAGLYNTSPKGRIITWGDKISKAKKGVLATEEAKKAYSIAHYNCDPEDWKGFYKKSEIQIIRDSIEYLELRKLVFKRDNYKCAISGQSGSLQMHHIESMNTNLLKSLDINNVITLHVDIHKEFHSIYGNGNNTREQFEEFINNYKLKL